MTSSCATPSFSAGKPNVAIIGFGETKYQAPFWDKSFEIWGLNNLHEGFDVIARPFTRWFQLHRRNQLETEWQPHFWSHLIWLRRDCAMPVYVWEPMEWRDIRNPIRYPRELIKTLTDRGTYHAGSFDWMVALAISYKFKRIEVYGVDFSRGGEPLSGRPCLEYWLGIAEGRGIKIHVEGGDLFRIFHLMRSDQRYGLDDFRLVEDVTERR